MPFLLVFLLTANFVSAQELLPLEETAWLANPITVVQNVDGGEPRFAVQGDNVYIVWEEIGITFIKSSDDGKTFSEPMHLAEPQSVDSAVSKDPSVAANGDRVYIIYTSGFDVFLIQSHDKGESFSAPVNVSRTNIDSPYAVFDQVISIDGNNIYAAWTVASGNWSEIYFSRSSDGGITFETPTNISDSPNNSSYRPIIASSGNRVVVVWFDVDNTIHHISLASSDNRGESFNRTTNFSGNTGYYNAFEPSLAVTAKDIYLAWREETPNGPNIKLAKSSDSGKTFSYEEGMAPGGAWPSIDVETDNVYMLFGTQNNENGAYYWAFTGSLDGGKTFSKPVMLGNYTWGLMPREDFVPPRMVADGANIFVIWKYYTGGLQDGGHDVFLVASYDEGRSFTRPINLSQGTAGQIFGQPTIVATTMDKVFVLWQEVVSNYPDILLVRGEIPESYSEPFKHGSLMTPVEPYNSGLVVIAILAVTGSAAAAIGTMYLVRKKRSKEL